MTSLESLCLPAIWHMQALRIGRIITYDYIHFIVYEGGLARLRATQVIQTSPVEHCSICLKFFYDLYSLILTVAFG